MPVGCRSHSQRTPPPRSTDTDTTTVADGGKTVNGQAIVIDQGGETATVNTICRVISDRIRDLERDIDCTQAELNNYQITFSVIEDMTEIVAEDVIEDMTEQSHPSDPATAVAGLPHAYVNGDTSER